MSQNVLIFVVDQLNGTLFPVGPADWLYAPNLKRLAARSTRFNRGLYRLAALRAGAGTGSAGGDEVRSRGHLCADCQPVFGLVEKYSLRLDPEQLFDLEIDPHERNHMDLNTLNQGPKTGSQSALRVISARLSPFKSRSI